MGYKLEICFKICCIGLLLFQGSMLNLYLTRLYSDYWWSWYVTDLVVVIVWIGCLVAASKRMKQDEIDAPRDPSKTPDEIKYAYIAWVTYICLLCPRIILLFQEKARKFEEKDLLGPNFLKVGVACTPLIFLLLVRGHHNAKPYSTRRYFIMSLGSTVTLDLFDSIDLLDFLFVPSSSGKAVPSSALDATLAFACINFFLPTLALAEIRVNNFTGRVAPLSLKLLYECSYVLLVNIPNLVIRSILWHKYDMDVSILIMKNVMCISLGCIEIYEYFHGEDKPKKCDRCQHYFQKSYFGRHKVDCKEESHERVPLA